MIGIGLGALQNVQNKLAQEISIALKDHCIFRISLSICAEKNGIKLVNSAERSYGHVQTIIYLTQSGVEYGMAADSRSNVKMSLVMAIACLVLLHLQDEALLARF